MIYQKETLTAEDVVNDLLTINVLEYTLHFKTQTGASEGTTSVMHFYKVCMFLGPFETQTSPPTM